MIENQLAPTLSLNGEWQIEIGDLHGPVQVPGAWEVQGYPLDVDEARYHRAFDVPADWSDAHIYLRLGAVSYFAEVSVNGQNVGNHEGLWTPFEFDISNAVKPGASNHIEIRVVKPSNSEDGRFPYRKALVGFIPYVSTTFGGIWQAVELVAQRTAWWDVHIAADWHTGHVVIHAGVLASGSDRNAQVELLDTAGEIIAKEERAIENEDVERFDLIVLKAQAWSPASPTLYTARLILKHGDTVLAETTRRFGFRQLHSDGDLLLFNGEAANLRGILTWGWDPETLAPTPTDQQIRQEFRRVRELGFNLYKLCLYVPPPNFFDIADEEGMLLWLELPMWWQIMGDHLRLQAKSEYLDIMTWVQHHPSVVIYSLGCELSADMADADLLGTLNDIVRSMVNGVLVCDNSGSGEAYDGLRHDLADFNDYHFYAELQDFVPLLDHFRRDWREQRPWIFGEFCYSDDYRDPARLLDAMGNRPWWRDLLGVGSGIERWAYRDQEARMTALGLAHNDEELVNLSRRKSFMIRKHTLETVRSRRGMGGYVVTGLRDTPISTAGLFDDHQESKFAAAAFRQFNADAVLLLEGGRARRWVNADQPYPMDRFNHWSGESTRFHIILSYVDPQPAGNTLRWQFSGPGSVRPMQGEVVVSTLPIPGVPGEIAHIDLALPEVNQPESWTLSVTLGHLENHWPLWIYPQPADFADTITCYDPSGILPDLAHLPRHDFSISSAGPLIASACTPELRSYVAAGGQAILIQPGPGAIPTVAKSFWGMSLVLLEDHPALARMPHDGFADLQCYHLATDYAFHTSQIQATLPEVHHVRPLIRGLDMRFFTLFNYLLEIEIGAGRMLATTLRFSGGRGDQVRSLEANITGHFLLSELIDYLSR
jgi:hypothetical protein